MQSFLSARRQIVVVENAMRRAFEIIVLAGLHRPDEGAEPDQPEQQCQRNEDDEDIHATFPALRAFSVTMIDEPDIASAAIRGVA